MSTGKTILIVDDFDATRTITKFTLQKAGYQIIEAVDGQNALEILDRLSVHLIITDLMMPGMNGLTLAAEARKKIQYRFTPILMLTTNSKAMYKDDPRIAELTGWIIKPYTVDQFLLQVQKAIR